MATDRHSLHLAHFRRSDRAIHGLMRRIGPFQVRLARNRFEMLVRSILSQQISVGAARSIRARLEALAAPEGITPERLAGFSIDELRGAGVSPQKARYIGDLAVKVRDGAVALRSIGRMKDEEVIDELTQIKGIGRWTAQMFLIFALGRPNVFPHDDLGVRMAIRRMHALDDMPDRRYLDDVAARWSPYASIGSWYCWRYIELERRAAAKTKGYPV